MGGTKQSRALSITWPNPVVQRRTVPPDSRLIAVSDIHGNLDFFQGLMKKIRFSPADILVLVGDMLEKGEQSLPLMRYLMELEKTHAIWKVCGNCDGLVLRFFEGDEWDRGFFAHYIPNRPQSAIRQMAAEIGFTETNNLPALREVLRQHFSREWEWLRQMPAVIETEELVFVHGGVPSLDQMEELGPWSCMKNDNFLGQGHAFSKYVVVGHWPVTLYRPRIPSAAPLISRRNRILSIDGGCVLKLDGQLNALLFPGGRTQEMYWTCYDALPTAVALSTQIESDNPLNIRWGRSQVEVLERGAEFSRCRHLETGRVMPILTRFLHEDGGCIWCEDATDYCLPVSPGDVLSISERVTGGVLAKKDGVTGWYWGEVSEACEQGAWTGAKGANQEGPTALMFVP